MTVAELIEWMAKHEDARLYVTKDTIGLLIRMRVGRDDKVFTNQRMVSRWDLRAPSGAAYVEFVTELLTKEIDLFIKGTTNAEDHASETRTGGER